MWVRLPDGTDDVALTARAAIAGVVVSPGAPWFAAEPPGPHVRLTFAGARPYELVEGVRRLVLAAAPTAGGTFTLTRKRLPGS